MHEVRRSVSLNLLYTVYSLTVLSIFPSDQN